MGEYAVQTRLARMRLPNQKLLILVMDDGLISGPTLSLSAYNRLISTAGRARWSAVMGYSGVLQRCISSDNGIGRIASLTLSTSVGALGSKEKCLEPLAAIAEGADAVAIHASIHSTEGNHMLAELSKLTSNAHRLGLPVLAAIYARDRHGGILQEHNAQLHAARCAAELGADLVKIPGIGGVDQLRNIVESISPVDVLLAGGASTSDSETISMVEQGISAGVSGFCLGRRIIQSSAPETLIQAISDRVNAA